MLTISPQIKSPIYYKTSPTAKQAVKPAVSNIHFGQEFPLFDWMSIYENKTITPIEELQKTKRPASRESTIKKLDNIYDNYKKSLEEVSIEDINNAVENIEKTTEYSKKEILSAMQKATQFGNMRSLNVIGKALDENNIGFLSNSKNNNGFGLNWTLNYYLAQKQLYHISGSQYGVFLDNNKLKHLESIQKKDNERFDIIKNNNTKYFVLSGFNEGISFVNRSKDLETVTREILSKKDVDIETLERAERLGIKPVIIKNENPPTVENIYNQLKPEQMSKKELGTVIDATVMTRFSAPDKRIDAKEYLAQYLENKLDVYTPERLSKLSKQMYKEIESVVKKQGKTMDDIVYYIPNPSKSFAPINHQYQLVNNISKEKFISNKDLLQKSVAEMDFNNKTIVILDDCALSGLSLTERGEHLQNITNNNIIYAPMYCSDMAEDNITSKINKNIGENQDVLIKLNSNDILWNKNMDEDKNDLAGTAIGEPGFENGYDCIIFPYMCPDNNSEFASNIGLFHHIKYDRENEDFKKLQKYSNIKSLSTISTDIAKLSNILIKES